MKKFISVLAFFVAAFFIFGCSEGGVDNVVDNGHENGGGNDYNSAILYFADNTDFAPTIPCSEYDLELIFSAKEMWTAESNVDWLSVSPQSGNAGKSIKLVITAEENTDYSPREGRVTVYCGEIKGAINIVQEQADALSTDSDIIELSGLKQEFSITAKTNVDITVAIPQEAQEWISHISTRALSSKEITFAVTENTTAQTRSATIQLKSNGKVYDEFEVKQSPFIGSIIYYTTTNDQKLDIYEIGDQEIISNTYENGQGIIATRKPVVVIKRIECSNLKSIILPNSVIEISSEAFFGCNWLESITIPDSVETIGSSAFKYCNLTSVTIPDSVKTIGSAAFYDCYSLTSVTIGNNVQVIGSSAFYKCNNLTSVTLGNSVQEIGNCAFSYCSGLTNITIPDSVTKIGEEAFQGCSGLTSVTIGNSVQEIGAEAFCGCSGTSITIPDSVIKIGASAFHGCSGLTNIGNSVQEIGNCAFSYCSGLTNITIPDSVTKIGEEAFQGCSGLTSVTIGNSVQEIEKYTFYECRNLASITISDSVTKIGAYAFMNCSLTSVVIGKRVQEIGKFAFNSSILASGITIPDSVTKIEEQAFSRSRLRNVVIGKNVQEIGKNAFGGRWLVNVYCRSTVPPKIDGDVFDLDKNEVYDGKFEGDIHVPHQSVKAYKSSDIWKKYYASMIVGYYL